VTKPRVSIVIPCLNAARWIRACVESALAQAGVEKEVIVVDDGSTDSSLAILHEFGGAIRLLETPHRGAPAARNAGLAVAQGEWVQFLDADDSLEPDKLAHQLSEGRDGANADVLYSPVLIEEDGRRRTSELDLRLDLFSQWFAWQLPQTGAGLWRRSSLAALGGWKEDQPCCQDHELYLRALISGLRFVFTPTPRAVYRVWSDETLCRKDPRRVVREKTKLFDQARAWLTEHGRWTNEHARVAGRACFEMARTLAKRDLAEAAAYYAERRAAGLIVLAGPAAPPLYRACHRVLGFIAAERIASALRRTGKGGTTAAF
jgi:glycosyltransferase involved in cell wall biosynthesis